MPNAVWCNPIPILPKTMTQCSTVSHSSQDTRPPNHSIPLSHTPQPEEVYAHLDRKCLVVLSETSSLQLYTYFTNEVKGYMQAWFHRTLLVPELNISAARKWAQCFLCRKIFFVFPSTVSKELIVSLCQLTALMFVFVQNKSPDSLFRMRLWQKKKKKKRKPCDALFKDAIFKSDQTTTNSRRQIVWSTHKQTEWKTELTGKALFPS